MRAEIIIYNLGAGLSAVVAQSAGNNEWALKWAMVLVGTMFGSMAAAFAFPNAKDESRRNRAVVSLTAGPVFSLIALAIWPSHSSFDSRDWIVILAAAASFFSWALVRWVQKRSAGAEVVLDEMADRAGIPKAHARRRRPPPERDEHEDLGT